MTEESPNTVRVIDTTLNRAPLSIVRRGGAAHAVLWPGNGARFRSFNLVELDALGQTVDLRHEKECAWYIQGGSGLIRDLATDEAQELAEGAMLHIGPGDGYRIEAGESGLTAIGGTVPVDPKFYEDYLG
ncbi:hypothetical protein [Pseudogemmobacter humi]|uniref:Uncharacterized protein n=1 Tax=Pseudogemmobacter humi TaxID=2483812 RepID=A0A3P5X948_9RHOB|nr:hypothetical protein [Pseudogemmobacter humi]VDC24969.1 hypothetical protein XINFAN_01346 [Pseudogemmobacter humi]